MTLGDSTWRWVPHLRIILTTRSLLSKTDQGDVDVGEHFHNFRTHPDERPYVGAQIYRNDAGAQLRSVRLEDSMSCTLEVCRRHTWRHGWMAQGDFYAGISLGYDLRLFLPLNISAFEVKDNKLKDWCKS